MWRFQLFSFYNTYIYIGIDIFSSTPTQLLPSMSLHAVLFPVIIDKMSMLLSLSLQQSNTLYHHFLKDTGLSILSSLTYHQCARILLILLSLKSFPCTLLYPLITTLVSLFFIRKKASQNYEYVFLSSYFLLYLFLKLLQSDI